MQTVNIALRIMSLVPRLLLSTIAVLGLALTASANKPKFATADAAKAFEAYYITKTEKAEIRKARTKLKHDPRLETMARTLGRGPVETFVRVSLPLAARGLGATCRS